MTKKQGRAVVLLLAGIVLNTCNGGTDLKVYSQESVAFVGALGLVFWAYILWCAFVD